MRILENRFDFIEGNNWEEADFRLQAIKSIEMKIDYFI